MAMSNASILFRTLLNPYLMSTSQIMNFIETLAKLQEQRASEEK